MVRNWCAHRTVSAETKIVLMINITRIYKWDFHPGYEPIGCPLLSVGTSRVEHWVLMSRDECGHMTL